jgi:ABC-type tungstate transport system permease subunit
MGATLQVASQKAAYTISDRGTYLAQQKNIDLDILFQGDPALLNVYHVIVVNPAKHPKVNVVGARAFAAYVVRPDIQAQIGAFGKDKYQQALFFPDAGKPDPTLSSATPTAASAGGASTPGSASKRPTASTTTKAPPPPAGAAR